MGRELSTTPAATQVTATPQGPVLLHSHFLTAETPGNKKAKMQMDMIDLISLLLVLTYVYGRGTGFSNIYLEALENHRNYQCLEDSLSLCPTKLQDALIYPN